ncbi:phosphorothioated DNA-binding restriction endonuclease [Streptomyces sp. NPDC051018]|uniref:phosphorothioated DNA-binding restriction endonuclease n=1 Tax=Streptomyces sp. NPDC051018 TaxID=3365639 RepID=UPI003794D753
MDWIGRVGRLRQWAQNGQRAPHKPLLMLYALGRFQREPGRGLRFSEVERELQGLLQEYGPPRRTSAAYPFHHLVSDGVWEVRTERGAVSPGTGVRALRESGAEGRLAEGLREALADDPGLLGRMAHLLLDLHFPPSIHADIAAAVGLDLERGSGPGEGWTHADDIARAQGQARGQTRETGRVRARSRAGELRGEVLVAYEYRCAFCGFDGAIGRLPVGLEAAHVQWWAFDGPDELSNCLCLCSLHHKLFDRGVLGLDTGRRITVSREFVGRSASARSHVFSLIGQELIGPQNGSARVASEHVGWHTAQVFRGQARTPEPV